MLPVRVAGSYCKFAEACGDLTKVFPGLTRMSCRFMFSTFMQSIRLLACSLPSLAMMTATLIHFLMPQKFVPIAVGGAFLDQSVVALLASGALDWN